MMMRCLLTSPSAKAAALSALLACGPALAEASSIALKTPRAFGYVIGDTLTLEAEIALDPGAQVEPASLPQPHKVSSWLDLKAVTFTPSAKGEPARLRLVYQNFFGALEPRSLEIPGLPLTIRTADGPRTLMIPAFAFTATPLRELVPSRSGNPMALQPDIPPAPHPLGVEGIRAAIAAGVGAAGMIALAFAAGWRPLARRPRPFAAVARTLRAPGAGQSAEDYRNGLVALHRAFDFHAGRRLLAEDADAFAAGAPWLSPHRGEIDRFFTASRTAFFGTGLPAAMAALPPRELAGLANHLATAERRSPPPAPGPQAR